MQPMLSGRRWVSPQLDRPWHRSGILAKQVMFLSFSTITSNHRENHNSRVEEGKSRKCLCSIEVQVCKVELKAFLTLKKPVPTENMVLISVIYTGHFFKKKSQHGVCVRGGGGICVCYTHVSGFL